MDKTRLLAGVLTLISVAYVAALFAWFGVRQLAGDFNAYFFGLNALALYLFLPLPFLLPAAMFARSRWIVATFVPGAALFLFLWGGLFLPAAGVSPDGRPILRLMTYNVLGYNFDADAVIAAIREADADVVGFQELNTVIGAAIRQQLRDEYPYQKLDDRVGIAGSGFISRYPFTSTGTSIPDEAWVGDPDIIALEFDGQTVTIVRFHCIARPANHAPRERQARKLAHFAREHEGPLIVMGDLNASPTNVAYAVVTEVLEDAWVGAGRGFGHTFPGASRATTPGSSRPAVFGITVPKWLVRIDYVFHSGHWSAVSARTGPFDGRSDHRPVVVELFLNR